MGTQLTLIFFHLRAPPSQEAWCHLQLSISILIGFLFPSSILTIILDHWQWHKVGHGHATLWIRKRILISWTDRGMCLLKKSPSICYMQDAWKCQHRVQLPSLIHVHWPSASVCVLGVGGVHCSESWECDSRHEMTLPTKNSTIQGKSQAGKCHSEERMVDVSNLECKHKRQSLCIFWKMRP